MPKKPVQPRGRESSIVNPHVAVAPLQQSTSFVNLAPYNLHMFSLFFSSLFFLEIFQTDPSCFIISLEIRQYKVNFKGSTSGHLDQGIRLITCCCPDLLSQGSHHCFYSTCIQVVSADVEGPLAALCSWLFSSWRCLWVLIYSRMCRCAG